MESVKKREIINSNKQDFLDFLYNDLSGEILNLLDDEGVEYLKKYSDITDRITYILNYSNYVDFLFNNQKFLDLFLSTDITKYYASLKNLNNKTYDLIVNRCLELNKDVNLIGQLISYFNKDYQLKFIDKYDYPNDLIYEMLKRNPKILGKKILEKYNIDLTSHNISIKGLIDAGKSLSFEDMAKRNGDSFVSSGGEIFLLSSDLLNTEVAQKLWNELNVYEYRFLINDANYCGDPTNLNNYAKTKEEEFILNTDYPKIYQNIFNMINKLSNLDSSSNEYRDIFRNLIKQIQIFPNEYTNLRELIFNGEFAETINLITKSLDEKKSDYIIDYHFEENYYNVMYDLKELLEFYYAGNIDIPEDRLYLYQQIVNIDMLSSQEKIELHNELKQYNMMEIFYDDMSFARKQVRKAIKDYSMVKEELVKFKDEELSNEYGVDVYNIEDNPFFAIVKSNINREDNLPVGHSYSLVGNGCISVFGTPEYNDTYVYDSSDLNPEQIVHVFPRDSFTMYKPFSFTSNATDRVEQLMMPDELLYNKRTYNEILILERGKKETDIDSRIPKLKKIALYCVDQITAKDVETAKIHNIGIMLINSKKYNKGIEMPSSIYRHLGNDDFNTYMSNGDSYEIEEHKKNR